VLDLFKKVFLLGLGTTILIEETVEKIADDLVKKGKLTTEEAKKLVTDLVNEAKKDIESIHQKGIEEAEKVFAGLHITTKKEYEDLEKRVRDLEKASRDTKSSGS